MPDHRESMSMWRWCVRESAVFCGLALLVGGGFWHGRQLGRWEPLPKANAIDLSEFAPLCDGWSSTDFELKQQELQIGGIDGYLARNYQRLESGEVVSVLILTGPGGPISVHPPEVCFAGRGYRKESKSEFVTVPNVGSDDGDHRFEMAVFRGPESTDGHRAQLLWAWTATGVWSVPANPRLTFARLPRLYKMYVSRTLQPGQDRRDNALCLDLMKQLIPEFQRRLSDASTASAALHRLDLRDAAERFVDSAGPSETPWGEVAQRAIVAAIPLSAP
jgi:hypothetical protein